MIMTDSFRPTSFRNKAWEALRGKWGMAAVACLIYMAISTVGAGISSIIPFAGPLAISLLVIYPVSMGFMFMLLDLSNGKEVDIKTMFEAFSDYGRYLLGGVLVYVYTILWSLLFLIPGIIKGISYSQTFFLMRENPELSGEQAIQLSMKMMQGHKMEYFLLQLSFIGWILLGCITLCIGLLWVQPYITTANAEFYKELKKDYEVRQGLNAA